MRPLLLAAAALFSLVAAAAHAATELPYTPQAFAASQAAGKPVLVDVTAPWCPTCAKQRPIVAETLAGPAFHDLVVYKVDFDSQKDVLKTFGVQMQSTLIVFHGGVEKGRSTGETAPAAIRTLLDKALG